MPHEILVHISAPTTKEGDDRYRVEALAYRNFKSARTIYLDERDGASAPTFQHPRHYVLQNEQDRENHESSVRTLGLDSFCVTEPNHAPGLLGTQVILDTQRAISAFDSQISTVTNSFYDGASLSWADQRPSKRPRTAAPIQYQSTSLHGTVPASNPPSSYRSPYAHDLSFAGLDPVSSQLPESYGLSKSGGSSSIRMPEEATNTVRLSHFLASPQILQPGLSGAYHTHEENNSATLLPGLQARGSPAISSKSTINSPSRVDLSVVDRVTDSFRNKHSTPVQRMSTPIGQKFSEAVPPVQQTSETRNGERRLSPSPDIARKGSPRNEFPPYQAHFHRNTYHEQRATGEAPLPVPNQHSPPSESLANHITTNQPNLSTNDFYRKLYGARVSSRLNDHEMRDREIDEDKTQSERSADPVEEIGMNGDGGNHIVAPQAPMLSLAGKSELSSATNDIKAHKDDSTSMVSQEHQMAKGLGKPIAPYSSSRIVKWPVDDCREIYQQENGLNRYKEYGRYGRQVQENEEDALAREFAFEPPILMGKERSTRPEPVDGSDTTSRATNAIASPPTTPPNQNLNKRTKQMLQEINILPLEVFSPKAPVGISEPITFVTPILAGFIAKPELRNRWKRASIINRPIKNFEIGHWVIETGTWTSKLQLSFWKDLTRQITLRQAGISTWCARVPEPDQLGTIKVYCWGEIVEHLYLFLFTISDTGVSSQEVCWLDGQNEVIVRVRHRQSSR